jgi:hypothetical protein
VALRGAWEGLDAGRPDQCLRFNSTTS